MDTEKEEVNGPIYPGVKWTYYTRNDAYVKERVLEKEIKMVVMDRGFLCGENLWELKHTCKSDFLIYSKSNMDVTAELKKKLADYQTRQETDRKFRLMWRCIGMRKPKYTDSTG